MNETNDTVTTSDEQRQTPTCASGTDAQEMLRRAAVAYFTENPHEALRATEYGATLGKIRQALKYQDEEETDGAAVMAGMIGAIDEYLKEVGIK